MRMMTLWNMMACIDNGPKGVNIKTLERRRELTRDQVGDVLKVALVVM
jgi:hypothetical protein